MNTWVFVSAFVDWNSSISLELRSVSLFLESSVDLLQTSSLNRNVLLCKLWFLKFKTTMVFYIKRRIKCDRLFVLLAMSTTGINRLKIAFKSMKKKIEQVFFNHHLLRVLTSNSFLVMISNHWIQTKYESFYLISL